MLTLYYAPSTASLVVHWLLIELGLEHELVKIDVDAGEQRSPEYLAINPAGRVPALRIDGAVMTEAAAIIMHLADRHGMAPPVGKRAAYYQWMFFCANTLQPAYRAWFYPSEPAGEANIDAAKAEARQRIEWAWQQVDHHLAAGGPYMLAELSALDFMVTMLMRWSRNMPRPAHTWPALAAFAARMKARPSFREVYLREGLTDWT